ncbi:phage portal protein [Iodobacter sp. CM08]|uniref:phage portal protein n=1 Tax=Iodobacter sp. CM08 TaxID=3085902 RepID=UPI0029813065|nr:phage portal protein [Iodobacter sp. CM08]MDW5419264.1 phage portal protein [Iodobacter sp. CM08]
MKKQSYYQAKTTLTPEAKAPDNAVAFTFGEPSAVLDRRELLDLLECVNNGKWYEPPMSFDGLAKTYHAAVHHSSPLQVKRNILLKTFIPHPLLSRSEFSKFALDYLIFGNAYFEKITSRTGKVLGLKHALAKYMRVGLKEEQYFQILNYANEYEFKKGSVFQLLEPDINQEIYGLPEYLAALNSTWLNESATLFRRRYFANGSHAGFILYMTDAAQNESYIDDLRTALQGSKGPGNFKNLMVYAPGGKKDGMQILPISEVAAKDDFWNIKNVTRDDQLSAHRVPAQLMGIIPNNTGGLGDVEKAATVFAYNEIEPLQERMKELNDWLGVEVIRFKPYAISE